MSNLMGGEHPNLIDISTALDVAQDGDNRPTTDPTSRATLVSVLSDSPPARSRSALNQSISGVPQGRPRFSQDW
jgi:hypothetical protein